MVTFLEAVYFVFVQGMAKRPFTEKNHSVEAFLLY